jgi:hypothetical protein
MTTIQQFDYTVDILDALLWQYEKAVSLQSILQSKQEWYDENQSEFWGAWFTNVFDITTANEFGLAVWSIILDLPLQIGQQINSDVTFGFGSETNGFFNLDNGIFNSSNEIFNLTLEEQRLLLRLRYFQLVSSCAVPEVNAFLNYLFADYEGTAYVLDGKNMTIRVVFTFDIAWNLLQIIKLYDLIPRATGVGIEYIVHNGDIFGFGSETDTPNGLVNLDNGTLGVYA